MDFIKQYLKPSYAFVGIIALAFLLRFINLGLQPLSDSEASLALQALSTSRGQTVSWSGEPAYLVLTSLIFTLFDQTNFSARFFPALFGSLVILLPVLFSRQLSKPIAMIVALFLALDPAMVTLSRTAGGATIMTFLMGVTIYFLMIRKVELTGIFGGLTLLGGVWLWHLLIPLVLAFLIWKMLGKTRESDPIRSLPIMETFLDRKFWIVAILTLTIIGTSFMIFPRALSSLTGSVVDYIQGWRSESSLAFPIFWLGMLIYYPIGIIFGVWGGLRGLQKKDGISLFFLVWLIAGLVVLLIHPLRDLTFVLSCTIPLYILAAREIVRHLSSEEGGLLPSLGVAFLVVLIVSFLILNIAKLAYGGDQKQLIIAVGGGLGILIISGVLIQLGWSGMIARKGYVWGLLILLMVFMFSTAWRIAGSISPSYEMMSQPTTRSQLELMKTTIRDVSNWNTGSSSGIDIAIVDLTSHSLLWELREFPNVKTLPAINFEDKPGIVISLPDRSFELQDQYRGQDFILSETVQWDSFTSFNWISWLVQRKADYDVNTIVLWVRADQFSDSQLGPDL